MGKIIDRVRRRERGTEIRALLAKLEGALPQPLGLIDPGTLKCRPLQQSTPGPLRWLFGSRDLGS